MIYSLYPVFKDYLWGGTRLREEYGKKSDLAKVAESWELSCHKDGVSSIGLAGMDATKPVPLTEFIRIRGKAEVLGTRPAAFPNFPVMIKLIDAKDNLSVQVHPDDRYAMREEGSVGKTEMWYIVDCDEGAELLYGFDHEVTAEEVRKAALDNTLPQLCNHVPVHKGDVFWINAGTLHAIGKGIVIAEIQQNSNLTYRLYDYGRTDKDGNPRELHLDKALDVLWFERPARMGPIGHPRTTQRLHPNPSGELSLFYRLWNRPAQRIYRQRHFPLLPLPDGNRRQHGDRKRGAAGRGQKGRKLFYPCIRRRLYPQRQGQSPDHNGIIIPG